MLQKGNRFFLLCILTTVISCTDKNTISNNYTSNNFKFYSKIYTIINDSIITYQDSLLNEYLHIYGEEWQIDSMVCINSHNDKLVATINNSNGIGEYGTSDAITKFLGKKINNKWYFFEGGGTLVVPRDMYGKDEMNPLSFSELSQIARKEFLASALIKNEQGEWIVSDKWIDDHFYYNGMCADCKTTQEYDSVHWFKILDKWNHKIDTNEYKPLKKHQTKPNS